VARPPPRSLLLPTEAHVEAALAARNVLPAAARAETDIERPQAIRPFVLGAVTALTGTAPVVQVALTIATFQALQEVLREKALLGSSEAPTEATAVALTATLDRAIGALRRGALLPTAARRGLGTWAAAVQERLDLRLRAAGWFDPRGAGAILARAMATAPAEDLAELGVLHGAVLRGVFPWDVDDLLWIEAIHRRSRAEGGRGVELHLPQFSAGDDGAPTGPSDALARAADPLANHLEKRWGALDDAPEIVWEAAPRARVLGVRAARTRAAEARAVAAAVRDAIGAGIPPERVAIVVPRTTDDALGHVCAALAEARIAFAEPRGRSILACPDGRAALSLLALAEGPFTRDTLLELLRAPGLHAGLWVEASDEGEASARVARLASRLRDVPVDVDGSGRLFVDAMTTLVAESAEDAWMPRALERLVASVRFLAEGGTLREAVRRFVTLLDRAKLGQPSARDLAAALADEKRGHGALAISALGENASALRRLRELCTEMGAASQALGLGGAPLSAAELRAIVSGLADRTGARAGGTAARAGAVRLARPEELAGLSFERIVVTGLVESAYGDDGEEEDVLGDADEASAGRVRARAPRRTLALAAVLASAREVVLTYSLGEEGDLEKPHALIASAILRGAPDVVEPASRLSVRASLLGPRSAALVALARGRPPPADLAERVRIERARHDFFMDPRTVPDAFTGLVRLESGMAEHLSAMVGGTSETSSIAVTAIERAIGCSFAGFARRVLRTSRKEDLAEAGDARERGTLVHRALFAAFEAARDVQDSRGPRAASSPVASPPARLGGSSPSTAAPPEVIAVARAAAERALGLQQIASPLRREAILSAVRDALAVLVRMWDEEEPMRYLLGEQRFGATAPQPWTALTLLPEEGEESPAPVVFLDGQIDRIDASADGRRVRVVDYKTGRVPEGEQKRTALQLPLYAAVAARALGASEAQAIYVRVTSRGVIDEHPKRPDDRLITAEKLAERTREARRAVRALWEGRVAPRPAFLALCATCDARDVCRRPAVMPIEEQEERS
jgi:ATP-dependent helicase/nuclease subunit B